MEWWSGGVVEWWSGGVVEWWSGGVVEWWSGGVVEWWSGGVVWIRRIPHSCILASRSFLLVLSGVCSLSGQRVPFSDQAA